MWPKVTQLVGSRTKMYFMKLYFRKVDSRRLFYIYLPKCLQDSALDSDCLAFPALILFLEVALPRLGGKVSHLLLKLCYRNRSRHLENLFLHSLSDSEYGHMIQVRPEVFPRISKLEQEKGSPFLVAMMQK